MSTPSLRALRAFAEVARAGSLAEAARSLHVIALGRFATCCATWKPRSALPCSPVAVRARR